MGAVAGGATGSLIGALVESGVPEEEAHVHAEGLRRGGVLLTVRNTSNNTNIEAILDQYAVNTRERAETYRSEGWKSFDSASAPYNAEEIKARRLR